VGSAKPLSKVTVIVLGAVSAPLAEEVSPTVHVEVALAPVDPGAKVTLVGVVALAAPTPRSIVTTPQRTAALMVPLWRPRVFR